jgi:hypothetical protein
MPVGILKIIRMIKVSFRFINIKFPALLFVAASDFSVGFIIETRQKEKGYRSGKRKFVNVDYL